MSLPNYLSTIKSSGFYRFVWDKSEAPAEEAPILRLLVGYSDKGPFNTPVYIQSKEEFKKVFGGISKKLERKGIFFHRSALQALNRGPILCLNLKVFNTNKDNHEEVELINFNANSSISDAISTEVKKIYNTDRFWVLEPERLIDIVSEQTSEDEKPGYITISATDTISSSNTIFVRSYVPNGYNVTFANWYSQNTNGEEMPEYLIGYENERVEDYFAQIYVFKGKITPALATSETLNPYFNVDGDKVTLKPYITNAFGEKIDTMKALISDSNSNFINSYSGILLPEFKSNTGTIISLNAQFNADQDIHKMMMSFDTDSLYDEEDYLPNLNTSGYELVTGISITETEEEVEGETVKKYDTTIQTKTGEGLLSNKSLKGISYDTMVLEDGEWVSKDYDKSFTETSLYIYKLENEIAVTDNNEYELPEEFNNISIEVGNKLFVSNTLTVVTSIKEIEKEGTRTKEVETVDEETGETTTTTETETYTYISKVIKLMDVKENEEFVSSISDNLTILNHSLGDIIYEEFEGSYISGYEYQGDYDTFVSAKGLKKNSQLSKLQWHNSLLNALVEYEGIRTALTSRVDVNYRYLVDTFEAYCEKEIHGILATLCMEKQNALALINFPSVSNLSKCDYTSFTENSQFKTKFIKEGGNKRKPIVQKLTLVTEPNGASFAAYFTNVIISENDTKKTVPAAALASNCYMDKYNSRFPYSIVAGPNYSKITDIDLVGPEFAWGRDDLDILEPFGVNAIIYVPGKGTYINSNQTAKQTPVSTLSKINVREVCIFIQDEIEKMMSNYQWEFNTAELRGTIKTSADKILEIIKKNGGVFRYVNVCDETNNTDDVINNEMLVISTSIEPGLGAGKMVQELTLYRKGGMRAVFGE